MNKTEPLGLPRGSVRALLTMGLLALLAVTMFVTIVPGADEIRSGLLALAVMAVKEYFDGRGEQNAIEGPALPEPVQDSR